MKQLLILLLMVSLCVAQENNTPALDQMNQYPQTNLNVKYAKATDRSFSKVNSGEMAFAKISQSIAGINEAMVMLGDYDNDKDLDFVIMGIGSNGNVTKLFRNDGNDTFTEVSTPFEPLRAGDCAWGDYDNDNDLDIFFCGRDVNGNNFAALYQNLGNGQFVKTSHQFDGTSASSCEWVDIDNDGDLDITYMPGGNGGLLYRNDGKGGFTRENLNIVFMTNGDFNWGDYDNDGDKDLLISGYMGDRYIRIFRNDGLSGFTDLNLVLSPMVCNSVEWGDYDSDGDLDFLAVGGDYGLLRATKLYKNNGNDSFVEVNAGLTNLYQAVGGFGDFDNDGDLDIVTSGDSESGYKTFLYNNGGNDQFTEITNSGLSVNHGPGIAIGDFNNDRAVDIVLSNGSEVNVYKNTCTNLNTAPTAPTGLNSTVSNSSVIISWASGSDGSTSVNSLSYNVYIGTSSSGTNILSPMASTSNGFRRVAELGSSDLKKSRVIKNLNPGTYYWSVQSIDNSFIGSSWAAEQSFTIHDYSNSVIPTINVSDLGGGSKDLQFGLDPSATDGVDNSLNEYVVPPLPPAGNFDARFVLPNGVDNVLTDIRTGTNTSLITKEHVIKYQIGNGTSIKITWNLPIGVTGRLQDRVLGTIVDVAMSGSGSYTVTNPDVISSLKMTITYLLGDLPVPSLKSPGNNSTAQSLNPTLIWSKTAYAEKYKLQVSSDANFSNIVFQDSTLTDTTKQIGPLEGVQKYYWRVRTKNMQSAKLYSAYSSVWNFTTDLIPPGIPVVISPLNNATDVPLNPKLIWRKTKYADRYNMVFNGGWTSMTGSMVDTTAEFNFLRGGSKHTWKIQASNTKGQSEYTQEYSFTTVPTTWSAIFSIPNFPHNSQWLRIGHAPNATETINDVYGESVLPPVPPSGTSDVRSIQPNNDATLVDFRNASEEKTIWKISFQPGSEGYPVTINWMFDAAPEGTIFLKDRIDGTIINVDMKTQTSLTITNSAITTLQIEYNKQITVNSNLVSGWNMVSIPVVPASLKSTDIFPSATSQIFGFNGGYTIESSLNTGKGYWVRYSNAKTEAVKGTLVKSNKVAVSSGWNMIGIYEKEVTANQITSSPANIINSSFFEFNNGYVISSTLKSAKGYWVRTSQAGELILPYQVAKSTELNANIIDNKWGRLIVTDSELNAATVYMSNESVTNDRYDMPPTPPAGIFDVRWSSDKLVDNIQNGNELLISSANYPITLRVEGNSVRIKDKLNGKILNQLLKCEESITISNPALQTLEVLSEELPAEFELYQNYPNPFNPATKIKFALPEVASVKLTIYNSLGEVVAELINKEMEAGFHEVEWNAGNHTSGIYFVQLVCNSYNMIKKIILLK